MKKTAHAALAMLTALGGWAAVVGPGRAAEPDGWLYVVNASARSLILVIDDAHIDLPAKGRVSQPLAAGRHGLAAVLGARTVSQWSALDLDAAGAEKGRNYWCFVGGETKGVPHLIQVAPADCAALVRAGDDSAAPEAIARLAPPLTR